MLVKDPDFEELAENHDLSTQWDNWTQDCHIVIINHDTKLPEC